MYFDTSLNERRKERHDQEPCHRFRIPQETTAIVHYLRDQHLPPVSYYSNILILNRSRWGQRIILLHNSNCRKTFRRPAHHPPAYTFMYTELRCIYLLHHVFASYRYSLLVRTPPSISHFSITVFFSSRYWRYRFSSFFCVPKIGAVNVCHQNRSLGRSNGGQLLYTKILGTPTGWISSNTWSGLKTYHNMMTLIGPASTRSSGSDLRVD